MDPTRLSVLLPTPGPFATALIDVSRDTEDAAHQIELRLSAARAKLEQQGTSAEIADLIGERVLDQTGLSGRAGRFVVASAGGIIADEKLPQWQGPDEVNWAQSRTSPSG